MRLHNPQGQDPRAEAEEACRQGLEAYERSCALCDSSQGDDLPGLLCNWGSGLLSAAQMQQVGALHGPWPQHAAVQADTCHWSSGPQLAAQVQHIGRP